MERYIDADALKRRIYASPMFFHFGEDGFFIRDAVLDLIENFPTQKPTPDVAEVPCKCRKCKHRRETLHGSYCLPAFGLKKITDLDAFCSYGERKEQ